MKKTKVTSYTAIRKAREDFRHKLVRLIMRPPLDEEIESRMSSIPDALKPYEHAAQR